MTPIVSEVCIPGRVAKAVAAMCSTDPNRRTLSNAVIRAGHLIATNGHVLAKVPLFEDAASEPATCPAPTYMAHTEWCVPVDVLKDTRVSEHLSVNLDTGRMLKLKSADATVVATLPKLVPPETKYPNIEQVIPDPTAAVARVGLDPDYMIHVAKLAKAFGWETVVLDLTDGITVNGKPDNEAKRAVMLRAAHYGSETIGLLMPKVTHQTKGK